MSGKVSCFERSRPGCRGCIHCGPTFPCEFILNTGHSPQYHGVKLHPKGIGCPLKNTGGRSRKIVPLKIGIQAGERSHRSFSPDGVKTRGRRPLIDPVKFRQLYEAGAVDSVIAETLGVCKRSVCRYRLERGLAPNFRRSKAKSDRPVLKRHRRSAFDGPEIMAAYRAGASDRELAELAGVGIPAARMWRQRRDLPSNYLPGGKKKENSGEREILREDGHGSTSPVSGAV